MTDTDPQPGTTRYTPQPPAADGPVTITASDPTVSGTYHPEPPKPARDRIRFWPILVAAVGAGAISFLIGYFTADDSDQVDSLTEDVAELRDDVDAAQRNAADARDDAARAEREADRAYDQGYSDGDADGYFEGYDQGWRDGLDPFEPYSPIDNVTGVA